MRNPFLIVCTAFVGAAGFGATCGGHAEPGTMLVSVSWLAAHAKDPNLVLLAVGDAKDYAAAHIPGSVPIELGEISVRGDLNLELPTMASLADAFAKKGVTGNSRIVVFTTKESISAATRVYLTLDAMGFGSRTSLLNGGQIAWQAERHPVTAEIPVVKPGEVKPCPQPDVIASLDDVKQHLKQPGFDIVDARLPEFYSGERASYNRSGHIAGAESIPFNSLTDENGKVKPREELQKQFAAAGVKSGDKLIAYCHIGQQATVVYFVSRYLGYDVRMFDGSWQEWSKHPELPTEPSK